MIIYYFKNGSIVILMELNIGNKLNSQYNKIQNVYLLKTSLVLENKIRTYRFVFINFVYNIGKNIGY
jgi:hypothetical protein